MLFYRSAFALGVALVLSACSSQGGVPSLNPSGVSSGSIPNIAVQHVTFASAFAAAKSRQTAEELVPNVFAQARGLTLSDSDIDTYIDPSVTGSDRALAHQLMRIMPANERGDFVYMDSNGRLMSNNPAKLVYVTVTRGSAPKASQASVSARRATSGSLHAMDQLFSYSQLQEDRT